MTPPRSLPLGNVHESPELFIDEVFSNEFEQKASETLQTLLLAIIVAISMSVAFKPIPPSVVGDVSERSIWALTDQFKDGCMLRGVAFSTRYLDSSVIHKRNR